MTALIVTVVIDAESQARFDALRKMHFPPERNYLQAHLTMFHALPDDLETDVSETLRQVADRPALRATVERVIKLGFGVAYRIASAELLAIRESLVSRWKEHLTTQDSNKREFHVTVQNKVDAVDAARLYAELNAEFLPYEITVTGFALWRYVGGPWDALHSYPFRDARR